VLQNIPTTGKRKPWRRPRIVEVIYPLAIRSTQDRHNWLKAMMPDSRMSARDRLILTRLALHLNLKTARLDPSIGLLALECSIPGNCETAERVVRRSLEKAEKLGWIVRHARHGGVQRNGGNPGGAQLNRSNAYRLTIPADVFAPTPAKQTSAGRFSYDEVDAVACALAYTQRADAAAIMGFIRDNPHWGEIDGRAVANILNEAGGRAGLRTGRDYLSEEEYDRWNSTLEELATVADG
jgi:hypothetical protein